MKRLSPFAFLIGLALFILLLKMVDLHQTMTLLRAINPYWLAAALLLLIPEIFLKSLRLKTMASHFHSPLKLKDAIWTYMSGQPLSTFTPAKLGDVARVFGLSRLGHLSITTAFSVHVADKVYDLMALGLLASIGLIDLVIQSQNQTPAIAALLGILLGILLMALILHPNWMRSVLKPLLLTLAPKDLTSRIQTHGHEFYHHLQELFKPAGRVMRPALYSLLAWEVALLRAYFCVLALGFPISYGSVVLLLPAVIMVEFLPISIMGFGTREAALFIFFSSSLVAKSALLSFSFLMGLTGPIAFFILGIPAAMHLSDLLGRKTT